MHLKKYRLLSPDEDNSGTGVAEAPEEEMEPDDLGEPEQVEQEPEEAGDQTPEQPEEELVIQLDEKEEEDEKAPGWVKDLRKRYREEQKARRQIEEELAKLKGGEPAEKPLTKPKLEDFDYDAEQYEAAVDKYIAAKADHDRKQAQVKAQQEEAAKEWEAVQKR